MDTMVSTALHFNMYNLESSNIKNVNIPGTVKSAIPPLVSYSSLFLASDLVYTQHNRALMKAVELTKYDII